MPFTEDLTGFFADFGVTATYNGSTSITVIFDRRFASVYGAEGYHPMATCKTSDVPSAAANDTLVISATTYTVVGVQPDGTGVTELLLRV